MSVVPLPLSSEFRALLDSVLLDDAIIDTARPWTLEGLPAPGPDDADLEYDDVEVKPDRKVDGSAIVLDFVPPKAA